MRWCTVQTNEYDRQAKTYPNICTHHKLQNNNENNFLSGTLFGMLEVPKSMHTVYACNVLLPFLYISILLESHHSNDWLIIANALQWRHNGCDGVSNH